MFLLLGVPAFEERTEQMWDGEREIWGERICPSVQLHVCSLALTSPRKSVSKAILSAPLVRFGQPVPLDI